MMMVLVSFSTGFYADLEKLSYALVSYENLLFIRSRSKKGFKCFFGCFSHCMETCYFPLRGKHKIVIKRPFKLLMHQYVIDLPCRILKYTLINRLCILGTHIDVLADAYLLHPPL